MNIRSKLICPHLLGHRFSSLTPTSRSVRPCGSLGPVADTPAHYAGDACCTAPAFDENLGFLQRIEEFPVQQLIPQLPVKGFDVSILPRTPWLDEERRDGQHAIPSPQ